MSYQQTPWPLKYQDMYSISSNDFVSQEVKDFSCYTVTNRQSPKDSFSDVANDSRVLLFGLSDFINRCMTHQITKEEVYESALFARRANSFGGPIYFPLEEWLYVVEECNGYLPVTIKGLKEGSTHFPNVPCIQIHNNIKGLGELCASFEAGLVGMVSNASARLTLERHWLDRLREWVAKDVNASSQEVLDQTAQFLLHDFSMRACTTSDQSEILGLSHLLVFNGSDNSNSCYQAWKRGCKPSSASSIQAQAHRNVQSFEEEYKAFDAMRKSASHCDVPIASYLMDCYNFKNAVEQHLIKLADKYPNETFVAREDSGDALTNILHILSFGRQNVRYLSGNSLNPNKINTIMQGLIDNNYPATLKGIFGVGGYLIRTPSRDSLSTAMKLVTSGNRPVVKISEDFGKQSTPGPNVVTIIDGQMKVLFESEVTRRESGNIQIDNIIHTDYLETYYSCDEYGPQYTFNCYHKFSVQQDRCINDFDKWRDFAKDNPNYGMNGESLSYEVKKVQKEIKEKYIG